MKRLLLSLAAIAAIVLPCRSEDRSVVIPIGFPDLPFTATEKRMQEFVDSAKFYLESQFFGERTFTFDLTRAVELQKPYAYYGSNSTDRKDARIAEAVLEACKEINPDYDFSCTDYVILVTAGPNESYEAGEDYFWPQQARLSNFNIALSLDGRKLDEFAVCTELGPDGEVSGPGDLCHEFCHFLGLPDLYDIDAEGSGGLAPGLMGLSLMDTGNRNGGGHTPPDFTAVEYNLLETGECTRLEKGDYTLRPSKGNGAYCLLPSRYPDRYHLVENRGDSDLLIVKINRRNEFAGFSDSKRRDVSAAERWKFNEINCNPAYQCAELVHASASGVFSGDSLSIVGIRKSGADFSFKVIEPIVIDSIEVYQDGASVRWETGFKAEEIASAGISWMKEGEELTDKEPVVLPEGKYFNGITGLDPDCEYGLSFHITTIEGQTFTRTSSFRTQPYRAGSFPFIMLDSPGRNDDGSFKPSSPLKLKVRNAPEAEEITWTFNGRPVTTGADGLWTIPSEGTLRARILWKDGSEDILIKKIILQ